MKRSLSDAEDTDDSDQPRNQVRVYALVSIRETYLLIQQSGKCPQRRAHKRPKKNKTEQERKQELEEDQDVKAFTPYTVQCDGCKNTLKLNKNAPYHLQAWYKHKSKCSRLTGVVHRRIASVSQGAKPCEVSVSNLDMFWCTLTH